MKSTKKQQQQQQQQQQQKRKGYALHLSGLRGNDRRWPQKKMNQKVITIIKNVSDLISALHNNQHV